MAFIDGWHTFDYTFIDFFFVDQVLKDGGILAFHDMYALSKQKVLNFIKTHRITKSCIITGLQKKTGGRH